MMGMNTTAALLPASTGTDTLGAYAILALIADPVGAKKRLDALVAEKLAAQEALFAAQVAHQRAVEAGERAKLNLDAYADRAAELAQKAAAHDEHKAKLKQWEGELSVKRDELHRDMMAFDAQKQKDLDAMEAKARVIAETEQRVKAAIADLDRRTAEFNRTMAPILAASKLAV